MLQRYPAYYPKFRCTASACGDNCCVGWEIDVDADTHARYLAQPGPFGGRLRESISADDPPHFLLRGERCPFLNGENLCDIYIHLGEDALCEICTQHPRYHEWFGEVKESGVGLCCEAAARLILERPEPVAFVETEIDEEPSDFGEQALFRALFDVRTLLFSILQDGRRPLGERLGAALVLASAVQSCLDGGAAALTALTAELGTDPAPLYAAARGAADPAGEEALFGEILAFFRALEPIDEGWPGRLEAIRRELPELLALRPAFLRDYRPRMYEYGHLAVYFVYRYLLKAVYDGDVLGKVKLMVVSLLLLTLLDTACWRERGCFTLEDRVRIAKNYSKEMEYCEENLERFWEESWQNSCFSAESLLALLGELDN